MKAMMRWLDRTGSKHLYVTLVVGFLGGGGLGPSEAGASIQDGVQGTFEGESQAAIQAHSSRAPAEWHKRVILAQAPPAGDRPPVVPPVEPLRLSLEPSELTTPTTVVDQVLHQILVERDLEQAKELLKGSLAGALNQVNNPHLDGAHLRPVFGHLNARGR